MTEKELTLQERMVVLGVKADPLPPEPEPIDREYYNLGLKVHTYLDDIHRYGSIVFTLKKIADNATKQSTLDSVSNRLSEFDMEYKQIYGEFVKFRDENAQKLEPIKHDVFNVAMLYELNLHWSKRTQATDLIENQIISLLRRFS